MSEDSFATAAGHPGTSRKPPRKLTARRLATPATLRRFARTKLTDITLISADFQGEPIVVEPWLWLYVESAMEAAYLGVYRLAYPRDDQDDAAELPDLCWRRSYWNRDADLTRVNTTDDPRGYLAGDSQLDSHIVFTRGAREPRLVTLIEEGIELFCRGVTVSALASPDPDARGHELSTEVVDDRVACAVTFVPLLAASPALEGWATAWQTAFAELDPTRGLRPDGPIAVSYRTSFIDLLRIL